MPIAAVRDAWRLSLGTLTVVPTRAPVQVDRHRAALAMLLAPVAVLPIAIPVAIVVAGGARLGLPVLVAALLGLATLALGSRALHLDGLADVADGLTASYDQERSLSVMKSGTSGPAGVAAILFTVGVQAAALSSLLIGQEPVAAGVLVILLICTSRGALAWNCITPVPAARTDGLGVSFAGAVPIWAALFNWLVLSALLIPVVVWFGLPWWRALLAMLLALVVLGVLVSRCVQRFGGVTGDVFGASVELVLATLLVALA
jgi:adenosylcobinamide-GDP ribazoletransferase